jgi:anti-anti-sigma factor
MSGLEHLDSTAVGVLVGGLKRFEGLGRRFYLVNPRERVASAFRITHLDSVFRTFGSVEEAVRSADLATEEETSEH